MNKNIEINCTQVNLLDFVIQTYSFRCVENLKLEGWSRDHVPENVIKCIELRSKLIKVIKIILPCAFMTADK